MRTRILFATIALLLCARVGAEAQTPTDEYKFEVGALFTTVNLEGFGEAVNGVGGRFGYNFNEHVALDAEGSFFPESRLGNNQSGQKTQGFIGIKAGARTEHVGLFVKARPGVMSIGEVTSGFDCEQGGLARVCRPSHSNFALDAGGVIEFYPTSRFIIRADVGDTIVHLRRATRSPISGNTQTSGDTTHNLQFSLGVGYRF